MKLKELGQQLALEIWAARGQLGNEVTSGYATDMLSCAMAKIQAGCVWVTLQAHSNIVAVASLTDAAGIIITEGAKPDAATVKKAEDEGVPILATDLTTFTVISKLFELGVLGVDDDRA